VDACDSCCDRFGWWHVVRRALGLRTRRRSQVPGRNIGRDRETPLIEDKFEGKCGLTGQCSIKQRAIINITVYLAHGVIWNIAEMWRCPLKKAPVRKVIQMLNISTYKFHTNKMKTSSAERAPPRRHAPSGQVNGYTEPSRI
jgi:hypothetical protein